MSVFMDLLCEMLPLRSNLQNENNPLRVVLDKSVCEWMDNHSHPFDELFLTTAEGGWLDAHGKDYGVVRRLDETDEDYRKRIIYEKLDELTPQMLKEMYNVGLYSYVSSFSVSDNDLTSDNPYLNQNGYMGSVDSDTQSILNGKFILDKGVEWI